MDSFWRLFFPGGMGSASMTRLRSKYAVHIFPMVAGVILVSGIGGVGYAGRGDDANNEGLFLPRPLGIVLRREAPAFARFHP